MSQAPYAPASSHWSEARPTDRLSDPSGAQQPLLRYVQSTKQGKRRGHAPVLPGLDTSYGGPQLLPSLSSSSSSSFSFGSKLFSPLQSADPQSADSSSTVQTSVSGSSGATGLEGDQKGSALHLSRSQPLNSPPKRRRRGELADFSERFAYNRRPSIEGVTIRAAKGQPHHSVLDPTMSGRPTNEDQTGSSLTDSHSGQSLSSSTSAPPGTSTPRRQLMPAIPTRRGSSKNENGSSSNNSPALGNQTNIQSLAQAIAARAQHIAAVKAAAAAHQNEAGVLSKMSSTSSSDTAVGRPLPAGPLTAVLNRKEKTISVADTIASDYGDEASDPEDHTLSTDAPLRSADGVYSGTRDRQDRDAVAQSFRWSHDDWSDYAAALSHEIDVGNTIARADSSQPEGVFVAAPSVATMKVVRKSVQYTPADLAHINDNKSTLAGLGIAPSPNQQTNEAASNHGFQSPLFAQFNKAVSSSNATPIGADGPDSSHQASPGVVNSASPASTAHSASQRPRPTPLSLANAQSPTNSVLMSPSTARSLASPSLGGRTPPPTMPPSEPLPPLPAESSSSSALRRILSGASNEGSPVSRSGGQRSSNGADLADREWKRSSDPSDQRSYNKGTSGSAYSHEAAFSRKMSLPYNSLSTSSLSAQSAALVQANRELTIAEAQNAEAMLGEMQRQLTFDETQEQINADADPTTKPQRRQSKSSRKKSVQAAASKQHPIKPAASPLADEEERLRDDDEETAEVAQAVVTHVTTTAKGARASLSRAPSIARQSSSGSIGASVKGANSRTTSPSGDIRAGDAGDSIQGGAGTLVRMQALIDVRNAETARSAKSIEAANNAQEEITLDDRPAVVRPDTSASSSDAVSRGVATHSSEGGAAAELNGGSGKPRNKPSMNIATQPRMVSVSSTTFPSSADTSYFPGRPRSAASLHGQTGDWTPTVGTPSAQEGYGNPNDSGESGNAQMTSSIQQHRSFSALQNRRNEMDEDSVSRAAASPIERIKRTESRFAGAFGEISLAFKQLQAEKRTLEKVVRATTPLDGVGTESRSLSEYLTAMNAKVEASSLEIRKLLELMEQQRSVMDYMADTHRLEVEALTDELEELKDDFDAVCDEADIHRGNAIQLTEDLEKAQRDAIAARAETLRYKSTLQKDEERKDHISRLLQTARGDLARLERERDSAQASLRQRDGAAGETNLVANPLLTGLHQAQPISEASLHDSSADVSLGPDISESGQSTGNAALFDRIAALEAEVREGAAANERLQEQLKEQVRTPLLEDNGRSATATSMLVSDSDDAEREREALREKVFQQEQDIAELRAQVALGALGPSSLVEGANSAGGGARDGLPAAREDQIRLLMSQMGEQRTREAQIRKAYRQVRDELRKMHSSQQHDRRRINFLANGQPLSASSMHSTSGGPLNSASTTYSGASQHSAGTESSVDAAAVSPSLQEDNGLGLHTDLGSSGATPRHLKRLSLPLINKLAPPALGASANAAHSTTTAEERLSAMRRDVASATSDKIGRSRPQSMLLNSTAGGTAPIFSSNRSKGSRPFSIDFHGAARRASHASGSSSGDVSPQLQTHPKSYGYGDGGVGVLDQQSNSPQRKEEEEDVERLRTPRQSILRH